MLKKSLPKIQKFPDPKEMEREDQQKEKQEKRNKLLRLIRPPLISPPPNLFDPFKFYGMRDFYAFRFFHFSRRVVIAVSLFFISALIYNKYLDMQLYTELSTQQDLIAQMDEYVNSYWTAREVDRKTKRYKKILDERVILNDVINHLYNNSIEGILITDLDVTPTGFKLTGLSENTLPYARLIYHYLSHEKISQVTIISASFDIEDELYTVSLEGDISE